MISTGEQAKYILENTFDNVYNEVITCVFSNLTTLQFNAIVHSEIVRARRERFTSDNDEGVMDTHSLGVILLNRDLAAAGLAGIDATSYFMINSHRYDFVTTEPYCDNMMTPYQNAGDVFSVFYVRRAAELESQVSTSGESGFSFGGLRGS